MTAKAHVLREAKSTIRGAGPGTGAMPRSTTPDLVEAEHAAWTTAIELVRATLTSATTLAAPFAKGLRAGQPVQAWHLSRSPEWKITPTLAGRYVPPCPARING
jgi:hypothetical protein